MKKTNRLVRALCLMMALAMPMTAAMAEDTAQETVP